MTTVETKTVVKLYQPSCSLTYGTLPCTASLGVSGSKKCFNTKKTCQSTANYNPSNMIVWQFSDVQDLGSFPTLVSVSSNPTELNIGGIKDGTSPFGKRSSITISISDFAYNDALSDLYVTSRGYVPIESGTFWSKFLARNPYHEGYKLEVVDAESTRTYFVDEITGPVNGAVTIKAYDPLYKIDDKKSLYPAPTQSTLVNEMTIDSISNFLVTGNVADFNTFIGTNQTVKYIKIDKEIISYTTATTSGTNVLLSGILRGQLRTIPSTHAVEKPVQRCAYFNNEPVYKVMYDLLSPYVASYINLVDWQTELDANLRYFNITAALATPLSVVKLVGELCRDSAIFLFWDENSAQIKMQAIKRKESVKVINDLNSVVKDSFNVDLDTKSRISRVFVYYNLQNPTESDNDSSNFATAQAIVDGPSEENYSEPKTLEIFSRWITSELAALQIAARALLKYKDGTKQIKFDVFAKDSDIEVSDVIDFTHFNLTDDEGQQVVTPWIVISKEATKAGELYTYTCEPSEYDGQFGEYTPDAALTFSDYTAIQREELRYAFYSDENGLINGSPGYLYE